MGHEWKVADPAGRELLGVRPEVGAPDDVGGDRRFDRITGSPGREHDSGGLYMLGTLLGDVLLIDLVALDAVGETLQKGRTVPQGPHDGPVTAVRTECHGSVVADEIPFPPAVLTEFGKVHLVRVAHPDGYAVDVEFLCGRTRCHLRPLPTRRAGHRSVGPRADRIHSSPGRDPGATAGT